MPFPVFSGLSATKIPAFSRFSPVTQYKVTSSPAVSPSSPEGIRSSASNMAAHTEPRVSSRVSLTPAVRVRRKMASCPTSPE